MVCQLLQSALTTLIPVQCHTWLYNRVSNTPNVYVHAWTFCFHNPHIICSFVCDYIQLYSTHDTEMANNTIISLSS